MSENFNSKVRQIDQQIRQLSDEAEKIQTSFEIEEGEVLREIQRKKYEIDNISQTISQVRTKSLTYKNGKEDIKRIEGEIDAMRKKLKNIRKPFENINRKINELLEEKNVMIEESLGFNTENQSDFSVVDFEFDENKSKYIDTGISAYKKLFLSLAEKEVPPSLQQPPRLFRESSPDDEKKWKYRFKKGEDFLEAIDSVREYINEIPAMHIDPSPLPESLVGYVPDGTENPYELLDRYRHSNTKIARKFKWKMLIKSMPEFNCSTCWIDFIKQRAFTEYIKYNKTWRNNLYIVPDIDREFNTTKNEIYKSFSKENFSLYMQLDSDFISLAFADILCVDFDYKDGTTDKQINNMLNYLVNLAESVIGLKISFIKIRTDRGIHVFLLSDYADYDDILWMHFMMKLCSDPWYVAFCNTRGWALRMNGKKGRVGEQVLNPDIAIPPTFLFNMPFSGSTVKIMNIETITDVMPSTFLTQKITFRSKYEGKEVTLKYFTLKDVLTNLIIGHRNSINKRIFSLIVFHYLIIEFFRDFVGNKFNEFKCSIFNKILGYEPQSLYTKEDVDELKKLMQKNGKNIKLVEHDSSLERKASKYVSINSETERDYRNLSIEDIAVLNDIYKREMGTLDGVREDVEYLYNFTMENIAFLISETREVRNFSTVSKAFVKTRNFELEQERMREKRIEQEKEMERKREIQQERNRELELEQVMEWRRQAEMEEMEFAKDEWKETKEN